MVSVVYNCNIRQGMPNSCFNVKMCCVFFKESRMYSCGNANRKTSSE